jgi:non-homologous end joining protein Ku
MAARPLWKGQLRLSLVAMAVELHSATRTGGRIRFRQIHGPSGKPIRYEKVVPGIGPVDRDEIMKGYEIDKDSYVLLETLHYEDEDRPPGTDNVIDLMAALKKSLQNTTDREGNSRRKKPAKKKAHSTATSKKRKRA